MGAITTRLRVIQPEVASKPTQDCGICETRVNCWAQGIKEDHVITNLLVCRLKRGIDVNKSAKLLLEMLRPKLKTYAKIATRGTSIDLTTALLDLESITIQYLQNRYLMGEIAYPLHYLFGIPHGVIYYFANNYAKKARKYEDTFVLEDRVLNEDIADDESLEETETKATHVAREVLEDGLTLNILEYRVMKFCLTNALDAKRPLNGLHIYLGKTTGIGRARVTKAMADAKGKLLEETQSSLG